MLQVIQNPKKLNEQELAIEQLLGDSKIKMSCQYLGETKKDNWINDNWIITFSLLDDRGWVKTSFSIDFHTGIGHRIKKHQIGSTKGCPRYFEQVVIPNAASVLYCLTLDMQANNMSFNEWCVNFGYGNDSISAFNTYQECCNTAKKILSVFTSQQLATITEALQDY